MEETQNTENQAPQMPQETPVSFPTVGQPQKSSGAKTLLIVGILILVGILGFVIYKSASGKNSDLSTEPTPFDNLTTPSQTTETTSTATPVATPAAADKSKVEIEIQNGTGITGEAAYLQTQLKTLGYTNIKVGNATTTDATATTVTFSSTLSSAVVTELTQRLNALYATVTTKTSSTQTSDVVVVTGLRKGSTPKPSATATPKATATPTATATPSN
jgi:hypothetical protein